MKTRRNQVKTKLKTRRFGRKEHIFAVIYQTVPEGGYVASAPSLPGCYSQGETIEEAEKNIKEAIECHCESLMAHGELEEIIPEESTEFFKAINISFARA